MATPASSYHVNSTEIFRAHWGIYRKLIDHNHMFHRELAAEARGFLARHRAGRPLAVLDLGCGDCGEAVRVFRDCRVRRYVGYDLSQPALDLARDNLAKLTDCISLNCEDLLRAPQREPADFDLVYSSFALHHLGSAQKTAFFQGARSLLAPGGGLLLIDVVRREGEDRENYLRAYLNVAERDWSGLRPEEFALIRTHVTGHDFPETAAEYDALARAAGFRPALRGTAWTWHQALLFRPDGTEAP